MIDGLLNTPYNMTLTLILMNAFGSFAIIICYKAKRRGSIEENHRWHCVIYTELWNGLLFGHAYVAELSPLEFDGAAF